MKKFYFIKLDLALNSACQDMYEKNSQPPAII